MAEQNRDGKDKISAAAKPIPTVEITGGPAGRLVINQSQLSEYEAKGYHVVDGANPQNQSADDGNDNDSSHAPVDNFDEMTIDQLKEYAQSNDIDLSGITLKADIIQAVRNSV